MPSNLFVRKLEHGADLTDEDRAALTHLARRARRYEPRHLLIGEAETAPRTLVVLEGWACGHKIVRKGKRQITDLLLPGDACHPYAKTLTRTDHAFATLTACLIAEVDSAELANAVRHRPQVARTLHWSSLQTASILRETLANNGRRRAPLRVAHLICEVWARLGTVGLVEDDTIAWPLTQEDVADATSLTSVHVNRTYRDLRLADLIKLEGRRMRVPDFERLAAFCDFRLDYLHLRSRPTVTGS